ncbi:hypothetical protein BOTCAL_0065g00280 [Botryotinia calthae]|uniref:Fucose-specific lectin n=1 Tax=Botryotinia calthae TaxID=38488 RepID=A0A4Y8D9W3_9HELO|nr:hypothetical protein BOTCAL_0065g00280 [Botryotinia calthae]
MVTQPALGGVTATVTSGSTTALQGATLSTTQSEVESTSLTPLQDLTNLDPVVISLPNGKVHAFAVGADLNLNHKWYSQPTGWSSWVSTGRKSASSPLVTHFGTATANSFVVLTAFTWTAIGDGVKKVLYGFRIKSLTLQRRSDSLAALDRRYDESMSIVGVELTTGDLLHIWTAKSVWATTWETWTGSGYCFSKPTIVCCKALCIDIFVFAADRGLRQLTHRPGTGWGTWQNLGGSFVYDREMQAHDELSLPQSQLLLAGLTSLESVLMGISIEVPQILLGVRLEVLHGHASAPLLFPLRKYKSHHLLRIFYWGMDTPRWHDGNNPVCMTKHDRYHDGSKLFDVTLGSEASNAAGMHQRGFVAVSM